ncbi:ovostatin-like [Rhinophrynus dorsalis]
MSSTGILLIVSLLCLIAATRSQTSVKPGHGAHPNPPRNTKPPKQKEEKHDCAPLPDAAQAAWQYALSVPVVIKSGGSGDVCINFMYHNESLDVTIDYEVDGVNHTILKEKIPPKNTFKCVQFKVVNVTSNLPVFISLVAAGVSNIIRDRKTMVIVTMDKLNLVQTDKSIYKPGQTVYCRLISLDSNLMPVKEMYTAVYLLDPNGSRLSQLVNLESEEGIAAFQFDLLPDASLGNYQIMAEKLSGGTVTRNVEVQLYDLPRFSLTLEAPSTISIMDKTLEINATSKYTYGQGVPGNITVRICRSYSGYYPGNACNRNPEGICVTSTGQMGADGIYGGSIDLTLFQMDRTGLAMSLSIKATLSEEGTGVQVTESQYVSVTSQLAQLTFDSEVMQQYYKHKIPYFISVLLVNAVGHPIPGEDITLQVNGKVLQNLTTNADGRADYELDTSSYVQPQLDIQALYKNGEQCYDPNWVMPSYSNAYFTATRFYSRTRSFVQVQGPREELKCGQSYQIKVQYSLSTQGLGKDVKTASFFYLAMSKVQIVQHGEQSVDVSNSLQGEFTFNLQGSYKLAPVADVIVYSFMLSEVIAHTVHLKVEKCFNNEVSMNFSKAEGIPGSSVDLKLRATSRSLCGLRVVDTSVELLNPNQDLSPEMVYMAMQLTSLNGYYVGGYNVEEPAPPCSDGDQEIFVDGIYYKPTSFSGEGDSYEQFKSVGLIFATNASIIKPQVCGGGGAPIYYRPGIPKVPMFEASSPIRNMAFAAAAPDIRDASSPSPVPITTIRKFFPESWNFNITAVGPDGSVSLPLTVPDTITSWKATGFCNSAETGFGMTKSPANFTSFMPFFVEVTYPLIITRGEVMTLRAFVSNYLGKCIKVRVTLPESKDYTAVLQEGSQEACLCDKQRASYVWNMRNFSLGEITLNVTAQTTHIGDSCTGPVDPTQPPRVDQVIKTVTVEPEGIDKEVTYSNFVCVKDTSSVVQISITPEANSVPGSHRASVTVIGDLMGNAANNLARLIRMPTGCGEQNLATLLPIPFVVKYVNCTGQLTDALLEKAKAAMQQVSLGKPLSDPREQLEKEQPYCPGVTKEIDTDNYHGSQNKSNMVIIDIKMLSGYDVSYTSLNQLKQKVARVDKDNNHLLIYLNWVSSDTQSYSLQFEMSSTVQNVQPQFVYIYDYYNKAENGVAVLRHPCSA